MENDKKWNIYVMGAIGSGKTEFAKALNGLLYSSLKLEKLSTNPFVEKMYDNPRDWAMPLQLDFLFDLYKSSMDKVDSVNVFDSGLPINRMFVERQLRHGIIYMSDKVSYQAMYDSFKSEVEKECVSIFILLDVELDEVKRRIKERDRAYEVEQDFEIFEQNWKDVNELLPKFVGDFVTSYVIHVDNNDISKEAFANNVIKTATKVNNILYSEEYKTR